MSSSQLERWQRWIVLAHVALAILFGIVVPPWEAHDETGHYAYVHHIATTLSLPDAKSDEKVFLDQSHQPPLYYAIVAGLTFWADRTGGSYTPPVNLFALDGTNRRGFRILLRERSEQFPWSGPILGLHAARLVSALLSGLMVWLIALTARRLFTSAPSAILLTTAIAAFNPQVLFMAGMVNNDVMVSLTGAALAYLVVCIANQSAVVSNQKPERNPAAQGTIQKSAIGNRQSAITPYVLMGLALGLCLLSKNSALILVPFTGLALLYIAWRQRWTFGSLVVRGLAVGVAAFAVAAPFYAGNYLRYGQWLVDRASDSKILQAPTSVIGEGLTVSLRDGWLPRIFTNAFRTFWGTFGWGNVQMPDEVYAILAIFTVAGTLGCLLGLRRLPNRRARDGILLLGLMGLAMLLLPGYRAIYYQEPALLPGRYLMPALTAYAGILGYGWYAILQRIRITRSHMVDGGLHTNSSGEQIEKYGATRTLLGLAPFISLGFALFALIVPFAWIELAYAPPQITSAPVDAPSQPPALLTFEDLVQVTNVSAATTYLPDREGMRQYAHVRLTWRALKSTTTDYVFGISILGRDAEVLGTLNVNPARGNYPSDNWNPGDTFEDDYYVLLEKPCPHLPALGRVSIAVNEFNPIIGGADGADNTIAMSITHSLQATDGAGRPVAPIVGRFDIEVPAHPIPVFWQPPRGMFDGIALVRANLPATAIAGSTLTLNLTYETWRGNNPAGIGFVHLFDSSGVRVAQDDHAPLRGAYPTDFWKTGQCIEETFSLSIPPTATGTLKAVTGFYAPSDGVRFTTGTPDDLVPLGAVQVQP